MDYAIARNSDWHPNLLINLESTHQGKFHLIEDRKDLTREKLKLLNPKYIFFTHWSYIIPPEIFEDFECVIFHMTDVPFGRGGSPLQNLIFRGIYETKISALRCVAELDAGPVYIKEPLSLFGSAQEIYMRAGKIIEQMICSIITENPQPVPQNGNITQFPRRTPAESNIAEIGDLEKVFDHIRMLDADGYAKAFIETEHLRFEFQRASQKQDHLVADVIIRRKKNG